MRRASISANSAAIGLYLFVSSSQIFATEPKDAPNNYSPYAGRDYPTQVFFGDTHHHSANSGDAFMNGDRLGPEDSYRLARGEEIVSLSGIPVKLSRPKGLVTNGIIPQNSKYEFAIR